MKKFFKQFGGKVTKELEVKYAKSPNWKDGQFQNLETTEMDISPLKIPGIIFKQLSKKGQKPKSDLPIIPFHKEGFLAPSEKAKFIWYGHSVVLMRISGMTVLIDPMLGNDTTPMTPFSNNRFSKNSLSVINDFPEIDLMLLTHDHYDHLDLDSIKKLKSKTKNYFVALGLKRHLVKWGIQPELVTEFDWWDDETLDSINITFSPTRHFSGRGLTDRSKCLWGGWVVKSQNENIWFSGDGGYGDHFKEIGKKLGPFDFGFMECGQYNEDWRSIHLFPNEAVQAALDARVKKAMPVHWGGFALSYQHTWTEPWATKKGLNFMLPKIGQLFSCSENVQEKWWVKDA